MEDYLDYATSCPMTDGEEICSFLNDDEYCATITATCFMCGRKGTYEMDTKETKIYFEYLSKGREMGYLQELFPKVPAWIRSGAIDQYSGGFCICPECSPNGKE